MEVSKIGSKNFKMSNVNTRGIYQNGKNNEKKIYYSASDITNFEICKCHVINKVREKIKGTKLNKRNPTRTELEYQKQGEVIELNFLSSTKIFTLLFMQSIVKKLKIFSEEIILYFVFFSNLITLLCEIYPLFFIPFK